MSDLFWLTDEQMTRLQPFFPKSYSKPRVDDRRVLSGIVFVNRNGLQWRDAPSAHSWPFKRPAAVPFHHVQLAISGN